MVALTSLLVVAAFAAAGDQVLDKPVRVGMVAVQATKEAHLDDRKFKNSTEKRFDRGTESVREHVQDLEFDTFHRVGKMDIVVQPGHEVKMPINEQYTLYVTALSKDKQGRIRIAARVQETVRTYPTPGDLPITKTRQALAITSVVAQDKPLRLGGFKLDKGELVIVLSVKEQMTGQ